MAGRKRKLPEDFQPQGWQEPPSDDDENWQTMNSLSSLLNKRNFDGASENRDELSKSSEESDIMSYIEEQSDNDTGKNTYFEY